MFLIQNHDTNLNGKTCLNMCCGWSQV